MIDKVVHLTIHGRVQGVGYRAWMAREANRIGLSGWVRNRRDGSVEATISGEAERVDELLALAKRGPRFASVTHVDATPGSVAPNAGFLVADTI